MSKNVFFIGLILAASGLVSPPIALAGGLIYGFSFVHPFHLEAKQLSRLLLQASVVGLGFGMDLQQVLRAGRSGFIYTAGSICLALLLEMCIRDRTNAALTASTLERYKQLESEKSVSPQEMDEVSRRAEAAAANLEAARAQTDAARAQESGARTTMSYTRLVAPFAGVVTARMADPGTMAAPGVPLLLSLIHI